MRRASCAVLAVMSLTAAAASAPADSSSRAPGRLFVSAKEWSLVTSRQTLRSGHARIQLYNAGEDPHDLRIRRVGGTRALRIAETRPGKVTELHAVLRAGRWRLWCSLPGHAKAGMVATLTVRP